ncbi:MAG: iron ABC transporter permease [Spirochaetaceae bacterium 4572_59]|nr:MAG: iron ABC transporter permease [Spirochaetaceae bacterium 4572_59]
MSKIKEYLKQINILSLIVYALLSWFIIAFLLYPNINLIIKTFIKDGQFSFRAFEKLFSSKRAMMSLRNSFILAFSMIITVNIVGTFIVLVTEYFEVKGAKILKIGFMSTLVYCGIVLVAGYQFLYSSNGFLAKILADSVLFYNEEWFIGYSAVLFIMTFACTSNHMIFLTNAIRNIDHGTIEAAQNMGASQLMILRKVVLPVLKPTFFSITILTFLTGLSAISAPIVVGGKTFQTINPMILQFSKSPVSRDIGALMAIVLGIATLLLLVIMNRVEKGGNYISISKVKTKIVKQKINNRTVNAVVHIIAYILFVIYVAPMILVILFSFTNTLAINSVDLSFSNFSLSNYMLLFTRKGAFEPYIVSIVYSMSAAVIVAVICLVASNIIHRKKGTVGTILEFLLLIPWLLPATLIAMGLIMTYDLPKPIMFNKNLVGSPLLMLSAYVIVTLPFSLRMLKAAFFGLDDALGDAAKSMGASGFYTFRRVILPILMPSVLAVIVLTFNNLLANYDLSVFLYHPAYKPLGIVIKTATEQRSTQDSKAIMFVYSVILMIISTLAIYFFYGRNTKRK